MSNTDILARVGHQQEETEFYTPLPPGYRKGHHKYVVVVGTVMSGLGKGIFSSSLAKLLQDKGLKVAPIKMEGYYNIDSGTLNPYRHGEVFVLDDGMETDMDLGTYERLLDQDLSAANFTTNGQIFSSVLKKEREGSYLGRDVQTIPHVTGEVKLRLRELARAEGAPQNESSELGGVVSGLKSRFPTRAIAASGCLDRSIGMSTEKALIVLTHLVDNAIRHNAKHIRLEAANDDQGIRMTVSNDGDPISEANRDRIFDAFFTTRRDTGGTGMGLAIVRAIMASHGGSIALKPTEQGTSFELQFPAA
jgi:hypothetical protein